MFQAAVFREAFTTARWQLNLLRTFPNIYEIVLSSCLFLSYLNRKLDRTCGSGYISCTCESLGVITRLLISKLYILQISGRLTLNINFIFILVSRVLKILILLVNSFINCILEIHRIHPSTAKLSILIGYGAQFPPKKRVSLLRLGLILMPL